MDPVGGLDLFIMSRPDLGDLTEGENHDKSALDLAQNVKDLKSEWFGKGKLAGLKLAEADFKY